MTHLRRRQQGFTLIELVMALAIASFLMLALALVVIQLFKIYAAGIQIRATQQNARLVVDSISRTARDAATFQVKGVTSPMGVHHDRICLYQQSKPDGTTAAIVYDNSVDIGQPYHMYEHHFDSLPSGVCPQLTDPAKRSSMGPDEVSFFQLSTVDSPAPGNHLLNFTVSVAATSAVNQVQINPTIACPGGAGGEYCSLTTIKASAELRGVNAP